MQQSRPAVLAGVRYRVGPALVMMGGREPLLTVIVHCWLKRQHLRFALLRLLRRRLAFLDLAWPPGVSVPTWRSARTWRGFNVGDQAGVNAWLARHYEHTLIEDLSTPSSIESFARPTIRLGGCSR